MERVKRGEYTTAELLLGAPTPLGKIDGHNVFVAEVIKSFV